MLQLRDYQRAAIDAVFEYWREEAGHPLLDMATGVGKSITGAVLIDELVTGWRDLRVMSITHVVELVENNYKELLGVNPFTPAGVFAASLGQRQAKAQIIFAQLQTVWNLAHVIGHIDVLVIDEVHLVPRDANTMYGKLIAALFEINPDMKIVGLSATVYRLDSGRLDEGDGKLFDRVVYSYDIGRAIEDGWLSPLSSKGMATGFDLTGVGTLGGDYKKGALSAAVDKEEITREAVAEAIAYGKDRRTALFFCSGVDHAHNVRDEVRRHGRTCETIHGKTPSGERRNIIAAFKAGEIWGVSNDAILTTGTNIPGIDLIADLAPTKSTNRYVQKAGRGTRPVWPAGFNPDKATAEERRAAIARGPKPNCLYLDYARNVSYHGPVDRVQPRAPSKGDGTPPVKQCPQDQGGCGELVHISIMTCPCCGYDFPPSEDVKITARAADAPILSSEGPTWRKVTSRSFNFHESKNGKDPSVKVVFLCGFKAINKWFAPQARGGNGKTDGDRFWRQHGGQTPFPRTALEWLERQSELLPTLEIEVEPSARDPKFLNPFNYRVGDTAEPEAHNDNLPAAWAELDDIPF